MTGTATLTLAQALARPADVTTLDLSRAGLTELPEEIATLTQLRELDLSHNRLTALPRALGALPRLRVLGLHGNRLETLPHGFHPPSLVELQLGGNPVRGSASTVLWTLPMMLGQVTTLEVLGLDAVSLATPFESLAGLQRLRSLHVYGALPAAAEERLHALLPHARVEIIASAAWGPPRHGGARAAATEATTEATAEATTPARRVATARPLSAEQADQRHLLEQLIVDAGLEHLGDAIDEVTRPSVRLTSRAAAEADLAAGGTRLGGEPDLAPGVAWPAINGISMPFLAQIRLEDVAMHDGRGLLPERGLLSFFARDLDFGHVVYQRDLAALERRAFPDDVADHDRAPPCGLDVAGEISIPPPGSELAPADPAYADLEYSFAATLERGFTTHLMLGYVDSEYAPRQLPELELLLAVSSDDNAQLNFGDAQQQCFYLDRDALLALDFRGVVAAVPVG